MSGAEWNALTPWIAPLVSAILVTFIPAIIRGAIDGKFAQFRLEEAELLAKHDTDVFAHPAAMERLERRVESSMRELKEEILNEIIALRQQIRDSSAPGAGKPTHRAKGNKVK